MQPDSLTNERARLDAVVAVINDWHGERTVDDLAREVLAAADAVDPLRVPTSELSGKVPLVLYFATRADADQFAAVVKKAFAHPVQIVL